MVLKGHTGFAQIYRTTKRIKLRPSDTTCTGLTTHYKGYKISNICQIKESQTARWLKHGQIDNDQLLIWTNNWFSIFSNTKNSKYSKKKIYIYFKQ